MPRIWTREEIDIVLAGRAAGKLATNISADILTHLGTVRTISAVNTKAAIMRAPRRPAKHREKSYEPDLQLWITAATQEARNAKLRPCDVIGGVRTRQHVRARWRAWRTIITDNPNVSVAGLGRVSGFDHTSILHSFARMKEDAA
jgi:hypothetical protein